MGGDSDLKRQWLHEALHVNIGGAGTSSAKPNSATDLIDPNAEDDGAPQGGSAPVATGKRSHNNTDLMDPNAPDDPEDEFNRATAEVKAAAEDAANKQMAEDEAEATVVRTRAELEAAKKTLSDKISKYNEADVKAHGDGGLGAGSDLPADMLPDCVPEPNKIDGPKNHALCKTHGHVLNTESKMIIAHTVAEYDARHPVPRPMESDCKPVSGKLPSAPDEIMYCEPHEHVVNVKTKKIVANSIGGFLKKYPAKPSAPSGSAKAPAAPASGGGAKPAAAPKVTADTTGNTTYTGAWKDEVHGVNGLQHVFIDLKVVHEGEVESMVNWSFDEKPAKPLPAKINMEMDLLDPAGKIIHQFKETDQPVKAGGHYVSRQMAITLGAILNDPKPKITINFRIVALPGKTSLVERHGVIEVKKSP